MNAHVYRGWRSTKLHLALIAMAAILAVYVAAGLPPDQFGNYCTALIAATGIYSGAAAAEKFRKDGPP